MVLFREVPWRPISLLSSSLLCELVSCYFVASDFLPTSNLQCDLVSRDSLVSDFLVLFQPAFEVFSWDDLFSRNFKLWEAL